MRLLRMTIFSFSLIAFLACNESPSLERNDDMGQADTLNTKSNYSSETAIDTLTQSSNQLDIADVDDQDRTKLYKDLGMSADQIERFEEDFTRKVNAIQTHGRGDFSAQDVENQEGQSMNAVLSKDQYKKYLDWKEIHSTPTE